MISISWLSMAVLFISRQYPNQIQILRFAQNDMSMQILRFAQTDMSMQIRRFGPNDISMQIRRSL